MDRVLCYIVYYVTFVSRWSEWLRQHGWDGVRPLIGKQSSIPSAGRSGHPFADGSGAIQADYCRDVMMDIYIEDMEES